MNPNNPFRAVLTAFLLWLVSFILKYLIGALNALIMPLYYIATFRLRGGLFAFADWLYRIALSNDQHGNVINENLLRITMTKKEGAKFGDPDDTISYVLARNKYRGKLTRLGRWIGNLLDLIDPKDGGHLYKAIIQKIMQDKEAVNRFRENDYFDEN